jgi:hypothetical protein
MPWGRQNKENLRKRNRAGASLHNRTPRTGRPSRVWACCFEAGYLTPAPPAISLGLSCFLFLNQDLLQQFSQRHGLGEWRALQNLPIESISDSHRHARGNLTAIFEIISEKPTASRYQGISGVGSSLSANGPPLPSADVALNLAKNGENDAREEGRRRKKSRNSRRNSRRLLFSAQSCFAWLIGF